MLGTTSRLPAGRQREADGAVTVDRVGLRGGARASDTLLAPLYYAVRGALAERFASRLDFDDGDEALCHIVRMGREHLALRALEGARAAGRPVLVTPNHHERWSHRPDPVWRRIYRDADLLFALTGAEVELLAGVGADPERVVVTGVGPVLSEATPDAAAVRAALGLPDRELVTFLGQQYAYKGVDIAVAAFERVAPARPDAALVIAGPRRRARTDPSRGLGPARPDPRGRPDDRPGAEDGPARREQRTRAALVPGGVRRGCRGGRDDGLPLCDL